MVTLTTPHMSAAPLLEAVLAQNQAMLAQRDANVREVVAERGVGLATPTCTEGVDRRVQEHGPEGSVSSFRRGRE